MKAKTFLAIFVLAVGLTCLHPGTVSVAAGQGEESLSLHGCLLLSRKAGVYSLHMEYNRVAVMGHADLANHLGHLVTLTGSFEERDGGLRFMVDELTHVAPSCEVAA